MTVAQKAPLSLISVVETSTTAKYEHLIDTYFVMDDSFYKVTVNIPVGGTIAVGTNCELTNVADNLNAGFSGHTIINSSGVDMPQENGLQFTGTGIISVTDDSVNGKTVVTVSGEKGDAATISVGTTTTSQPGTNASVTNSGTTSDAVLNFTIPRGDKSTIEVGTTTTLGAGASATVTDSGTSTEAVFNFGIPQGIQGEQGLTGQDASVTIGTTTTLPAGSNATVTNTGTAGSAVFNFGIPKGVDGTGAGTITAVNTTAPISGGGTSGDVTVTHALSGVTAGVYKSVTVNNTGHVTAGTNPTTLSGYGITDAKITSGAVILGTDTITPYTTDNPQIDISGTAAKATADASGNVITSTYAPLVSPVLTGTPVAPTAVAGTNTTQIATTAFVKTAVDNATPTWGNIVGTLSNQTDLQTALNAKANQTSLDTTNANVTSNTNAITSLQTYEPKYRSTVSIATTSIASDSTYTAYPYRSTLQTWTGITANYRPDSSLQPDNAYTDMYGIETVADGYYVYFASMPTDAVVFNYISVQLSNLVS